MNQPHHIRSLMTAINKAHELAGDWTPEDEARELRRERRDLCLSEYHRCGLKLVKGIRFSSPEARKLVHPDILSALEHHSPGMGSRLICGRMGIGKLVGAQMLFSRIWGEIADGIGDNFARRAKLRYATASDIAPERFPESREAASLFAANHREWRTCSLLVIDELGKGRDNRDRDLFNCVDDRYRNGLDTVGLSGNPAWAEKGLPGAPLADLLGAELVDRFIRAGPSGKPGGLITITEGR